MHQASKGTQVVSVDLSPIPPKVLARVLRHYLSEACSGKVLRSNYMFELALSARILIENLAVTVPDAAEAVASVVTLFQKPD
jgi:hypothetical protein